MCDTVELFVLLGEQERYPLHGVWTLAVFSEEGGTTPIQLIIL